MTTPIEHDEMSSIREKMASFLMYQVIDRKGEFYCDNPGI
ncbi:hypothetical protein HU200_065914 [Digitaria exilis]|uniref:Uncharacterized protein n=1 Tax=Digitaria exilis TaxID=1010633 RepID=A0A835A352_9POAL|nr:hypothetical protein HU200_065914 [Digitaria exilis]